MVVNVYVEGGVVNGNVDATTNNNSEALREELNRFMQRALNRNDISIVVKKCSGYKEAAKQFINATDKTDNYLYVDLDCLFLNKVYSKSQPYLKKDTNWNSAG